MNLKPYYEMQNVLDLNIIETKQLDPSKPEFMRKRTIAFKQEFGELLQRLPEVFKDWSHKKNIIDDETLEEWVDGLHFLLSIGNWNNWSHYLEELTVKDIMIFDNNSLDEITEMIYEASFKEFYDFTLTLCAYYSLIRRLGYTDEQIEAAYKNKNQVNHARQAEGY